MLHNSTVAFRILLASSLKSHEVEIYQNLLVKPFSLLLRLEMLKGESAHKAEKTENTHSKARNAEQQLEVSNQL